MRGGHPEHREPGGGWGTGGWAAAPGGGEAAGRVLRGATGGGRGPGGMAPGAAMPLGRPSAGPRQEYLDAFEDTAERHGGPAGHPGTAESGRPGTAQPGRPGTAESGRPAGHAARAPYAEAAEHAAAVDERPDGAARAEARTPAPARPPLDSPAGERRPAAPPAGVPPQSRPAGPAGPGSPAAGARGPRGRGRGGRVARLAVGLVAAATTTVLAVAVAGQVAGTGGHRKEEAAGPPSERSADAANPASRSLAGRGLPPAAPSPRPTSYPQLMSSLMPLAADFRGDGDFETVPGHERGPQRGQVLRYRVDVEKGLPLDGALFAEAVQKTLNDERSWAHGGVRSFERVDGGDPDFVVTLASPETTDVWCAKSGLDTSEEHVSCDSAATERVMINGFRWARGAVTFGHARMWSYRQMLINHEVGHRLGHNHVGCPADGALAPVMMQQTKFLTTGNATCRPNAWPYPRG